MWHFEFSNGFKSNKERSKKEVLYWVAVYIRWEFVTFPEDPDWDEEEFRKNIPDILIYNNEVLDEVINGRQLYEEMKEEGII